MENKPKENRLNSKRSETSMSNAFKVICKEKECIGELPSDNQVSVTDQENKLGENKKPATRSSMTFGDGGSCSDEECIGQK